MQVTVEIRVEPQPRAYWPIVFRRYPCRHRDSPVAEDPARATVYNRFFEECIPGEPAPCFQLRANAFVVTNKRDQFSWTAAVQHSDQVWQKTRRKSLSANVLLEISPH
jgi:hypothetical protein